MSTFHSSLYCITKRFEYLAISFHYSSLERRDAVFGNQAWIGSIFLNRSRSRNRLAGVLIVVKVPGEFRPSLNPIPRSLKGCAKAAHRRMRRRMRSPRVVRVTSCSLDKVARFGISRSEDRFVQRFYLNEQQGGARHGHFDYETHVFPFQATGSPSTKNRPDRFSIFIDAARFWRVDSMWRVEWK